MRTASAVGAAIWTSLGFGLAASTGAQTAGDQAARNEWLISGPEEVVAWTTFDPTTVIARLPGFLRFVTVGELAGAGIPWAGRYLIGHPAHTGWGVSFVEVVRADTFAIAGREPNWPEHGAAAIWFARVVPKGGVGNLGAGLPLLMLEFWIPDTAYVTFMRHRGYYATYADVRLSRQSGRWQGSVNAPGLTIRVACTPGNSESGGANSSGSQVLIPPKESGLNTVVQIAFTGHRERTCGESASLATGGRHPLRSAVAVEAVFQYGYRLLGAPVRR